MSFDYTLFLSGLFAGVSSSSLTHFIDVQKVSKQLLVSTHRFHSSPSMSGSVLSIFRHKPAKSCSSQTSVIHGRTAASFSSFNRSVPRLSIYNIAAVDSLLKFNRGLIAGAGAQGIRFGVTIWLKELTKSFEFLNQKSPYTSFGVSMACAGIGEFVTNPLVTIKNVQISHNITSPITASKYIWKNSSFFRGVGSGVVRKSLANAIVLETMSPVRTFLYQYTDSRILAGILAGGITGGAAEVITNPIDRVKTLIQSKPNTKFVEATLIAVRNPLAGAGYACARKAAIRGINWGVLTIFCT